MSLAITQTVEVKTNTTNGYRKVEQILLYSILRDRGVEKSRITAKGYGESKPVNECTNGVKCSEEAHQLNRRTEFTIIKQ